MKIRHYIAEDTNILSIQFREDIEPDYGTEIAPGVTLHYAGKRGERDHAGLSGDRGDPFETAR